MKVTHIIDSGGYYGAEVMLVHLCQAQQKAGLQVEVISIGTRGNYKKPLEEKLEKYGIPCLPWRMLALPDLRDSFKILKHCTKNSTDIIHSHGYKGNILLSLIPKRRRKIPVIATVHGYTRQNGFSKMAINQWLDRFLLPRLDAVVLVSEGMRHQIPENTLGSKLHVIPNGIPSESISKPEEAIPFFEKYDYKIAAVGRLSTEKNFQLLINAMSFLIKEEEKSKLVIYGEGKERENLETLIKNLKLENHVFLPGYLSDPIAIYKGADVFVNCSLTEGMPITILEALREGCAIVATQIPANREVLSLKNDAVILTEASPEKIKKALIDIKKHSSKKSDLLKKFFLSNYTMEKSCDRYTALYESIAFKNTRNNF